MWATRHTLFSRYISIEYRLHLGAYGYIFEYTGNYMYTNLNGNERRRLCSVVFIVFLFYPTPSIDTNILFDFIIYSNCYQSIYRMAAFIQVWFFKGSFVYRRLLSCTVDAIEWYWDGWQCDNGNARSKKSFKISIVTCLCDARLLHHNHVSVAGSHTRKIYLRQEMKRVCCTRLWRMIWWYIRTTFELCQSELKTYPSRHKAAWEKKIIRICTIIKTTLLSGTHNSVFTTLRCCVELSFFFFIKMGGCDINFDVMHENGFANDARMFDRRLIKI